VDAGATAQSRPWLALGQEIIEVLDKVDPEAFFRVLRAFDNRERRWFFSGQGRSGLAAGMAAMRAMHLGRTVHVVGEASAPSIRADDGLVMISGSGETPVSVSFARIAKKECATLIVVTREPESALAKLADEVLHVPVARSAQFGGSLFEQCSLVLLDAVMFELARHLPRAHERMAHRHTNLQ
jgi:6-phospho-3-hexuloisomerase